MLDEEVILGLASRSEALRGSEDCGDEDGGYFGGKFSKVWAEMYLMHGRLRGWNIYTGVAAGVGNGSGTCYFGSVQSGGGCFIWNY